VWLWLWLCDCVTVWLCSTMCAVTQGPVRFAGSSGTMHINIVGARNLNLDADDGSSVVGYLNGADTPCFETEPSFGGKNPRWKAKMSVALDWSPKEDAAPVLMLKVQTKTLLGLDSSVASRLVHLAPFIMYPEQVCETWLPLDDAGNDRRDGELHLILQFIPDAHGRLAKQDSDVVTPFAPSLMRELRDPVHQGGMAIKVMAVRGLESEEWIGKEDPYVEVTLRETGEVAKTRTLEDCGTRATWNEILEMPYSDRSTDDANSRTRAVTPVSGRCVCRAWCVAGCGFTHTRASPADC